MSKKIRSRTKTLLSVMLLEITPLKAAIVISVVLLTGNLSAIVDAIFHPEIPYFDEEHLIVGGAYALLVSILFLFIGIYYARHKQEEDEIKGAKEEWERTFDAITEPIMILDLNHKIVKANKVITDKLGIAPLEAQGLTCYKAVHGLEAPHPDCPHSKLLADGQVHSTEMYEERLGGYFIITVSPIYDSEGRLTGSIYAGLDITDRMEAEKALKESETKYRNIFDNARDIIFTLNKDTLFTSLNQAFEKISGWSGEEWLGKSFAPILHPDDLPKAVVVFQKIMQGKKEEMFELRVLKKSGDYFIGEFTVAPIKQDETVSAALGHVRDITERKLNEERLRMLTAELELKIEERTGQLIKAQEELARKERLTMIGQLAGGVGHELRNPLGVISNAVYFLKSVLPDAVSFP